MNFQDQTKAQVESQIQQSLSRIKQYLVQAETKMRNMISGQQSPQSVSHFEHLLEMADAFESFSYDGSNEIANCAYYAHNLLNEIGASVSPQGTNIMSDLDHYPVAQQAKVEPANITNQKAVVNKDELGDLFDGIYQNVTNEFNQLLLLLRSL